MPHTEKHQESDLVSGNKIFIFTPVTDTGEVKLCG